MYKEIEAILPRGATLEYEADEIPYVIHHVYKPDFTITYKDGTKVYCEAKGAGRQWDDIVRRKMIAVRDQNPDKDIRIVFYRDAEFGHKSKKSGRRTKQSEWATKNNFLFSIKNFNEQWFEV